MKIFADMVPSPVAPLLVAVDETGALRRLGFAARRSRGSLESELDALAARASTDAPAEVAWSAARVRPVARQLREYFRGERRGFELELRPDGTPFQLAVWSALRRIPYGRTASYGDVARAVGSPSAFRAVGQANHVNPIAIVIPCHRVVGSDGSLTGFGGGLDVKRALLELESAGVAPSLFDAPRARRGYAARRARSRAASAASAATR